MRGENKTKELLIHEPAELHDQVVQYKKKNEELTRQIEQLSITIQSIGDGVITTDKEGKIIFFNSKAEELTGWTCEEATRKSLEEVFCLINKESREEFCINPVKRAIEIGEKVGLTRDTVLVTRDGSKRFVSASCAPVRNQEDEIAGAVLVFRDISRIKQAEEAVIESEKKYRTIVESSSDLIYEVDSEAKILYVNPVCKEIAGYEQAELLGKSAFDFIHPDDLLNAVSVFQRAVLNSSTENVTFRAKDKSGQYHWLDCTGNPFHSATGEIRGVIITRDITERKKAEEELIALNTLMKAVHKFLDLHEVYKVALDTIMTMENVDMSMIYLVDKEKNEAVLQASRNVPKFYIERAERIPYPKGVTWKAINSGNIINIENVQDDPDIGAAGRDLGHHSILGIPIFFKNEVIGVIWFLSYKERKFSEREVSFLTTLGDQIAQAIARAKMLEEIKFAHEQLIQSEKLASLGQLISSIAHEINNPLTPIIGYSQTLLKHPNLDERMKKSLEVIHSSAQRVVRIIDKLLSFSRKNKPLRTYEDINYLVEQSLEFREYQLKLENIEIVKELDPKLPKTMVDPNQIQQVLTNIILNAEQAMSESHSRGQLQVRTGLKKKTHIEISFSDDGPGIPKDVIGKVFDPFFTTKEPGKGTGLGLAIAYGITKEHGGEIYVSSEEGQGTTFLIDLPVLERKAVLRRDEEKTTPENPITVKGKRMLIVEDEEIVVNLIKGVLEEEDIIVDFARNGKEALKIIGTNQYDLIVCDIRMPQMNGIALYNEVKTMNPDLARRIIFITGDPSSETIDFINETGNEFITKPFKIEKFMTRINSVL